MSMHDSPQRRRTSLSHKIDKFGALLDLTGDFALPKARRSTFVVRTERRRDGLLRDSHVLRSEAERAYPRVLADFRKPGLKKLR